MPRIWPLWLMLLSGIALAQPVDSQGFPRLVVDALGRQVEIPAKPRRIVAIFASNVEILNGIGAGDAIVGVEAFTRYPPEIAERAKVGGRLGFSVEAIARLRADLVVMTPARQAATLVEPLQRIGIPALVLDHRDLNTVMANIRLLGSATGNEAQARQLLANLDARLEAVRARLAGQAPVRVYLETGASERGTYLSVRDGTYTADILRLAGGENVFAGNALSQVGGESVFRANPGHIVVAGPPERLQALPQRPGWASIGAVRDNRLAALPSALLLIPGPRVVEGVEQLARLLHPSAFAEPSPGMPSP
ncbi:ABC transporter substrate-binding protein [Pseudomonas sp. ABC1]|uniref:ABC transporter substrate-binding protein n=1 Tax=Pseudomonas sp. ABC1 TaxID=2748080 RepID=UPI0015C3B9CA|nr:ABC transporter substrate-binding protein [Pseudomonas sp. ABC1]QLF92145.1 ABC transporter substrate-binding protein [Pseudomonas sp. ABC1]